MAEPKSRESYEPPRVVRVRLVADEIAVGNCKAVAVPGSNGLLCNNGGVITNRSIGS